MLILYGIKNCDTCRKASAWLTAHDHPHRLHDLRTDGVDAAQVKSWADRLGWESLLNRKSTTWRGLADADKSGIDHDKALALMLTHPTLIKRPVLSTGVKLVLGFSADRYAEAL